MKMIFKTLALNSLLCISTMLNLTAAEAQAAKAQHRPVYVSDFLPGNCVSDGAVSCQKQLQEAVDAVDPAGGTLVFAPVTYLISDPSGVKLHSNLTLSMEGATFLFDAKCSADGQLFSGNNISNLCIKGGCIIGRNDVWPAGVNIRGIYLTGECSGIRISDMHMRDLSSNGIGIFAHDTNHPATDIWIVDTVIDNSCNRYGDYQAPPPERMGPEKGSKREDQGLICMYFVHDFVVRGCRFEDSRSDGTHFYFCRSGHFSDNRVYRSKMGGYFLESCENILAVNNIIRDNGSRGVTIERGSQFCTLTGNTITGSGREGLWIPDSMRCVITGNVFSLNGRKTNGEGDLHKIWNANITINQARGDVLKTPTAHYLIAGNIIETDMHQVAAIRVDTREETRDIVIQGNQMTGDNPLIRIEGPDWKAVTAKDNTGAKVERVE